MTPTVGIGIVNRDRRELLLRCLESLTGTGPHEVVVVDNGSTDGSADAVRERHPEVRVVEAGTNLGFAGGANGALRELDHLPYVALLNNDTVVEPRWLFPLVEVLETDPGLGAAAPKILFDGQFVEVALEHQAAARSKADPRPVGVRLDGVRVGGQDAWRRAQFAHGWHREEHAGGKPFRWSSGPATIRVPAGDRIELRLDGAWATVTASSPPIDVINNAGSILVDGGYGADRGFEEADTGQYDEPTDVFAWCGAAVLLRRAYLDDVGDFDERLFLYYEDFDLSWRGQARGWRYRYVPASVIRHVHTASSVEGSEAFDHYVERNRLLVHVKNAPAGYTTRVVLDALWKALVIARREGLRRRLLGGRPDWTLARRRLRAFGSFLRLLPAFLVTRGRLRRRRQQPYEEQMRWLVRL